MFLLSFLPSFGFRNIFLFLFLFTRVDTIVLYVYLSPFPTFDFGFLFIYLFTLRKLRYTSVTLFFSFQFFLTLKKGSCKITGFSSLLLLPKFFSVISCLQFSDPNFQSVYLKIRVEVQNPLKERRTGKKTVERIEGTRSQREIHILSPFFLEI